MAEARIPCINSMAPSYWKPASIGRGPWPLGRIDRQPDEAKTLSPHPRDPTAVHPSEDPRQSASHCRTSAQPIQNPLRCETPMALLQDGQE